MPQLRSNQNSLVINQSADNTFRADLVSLWAIKLINTNTMYQQEIVNKRIKNRSGSTYRGIVLIWRCCVIANVVVIIVAKIHFLLVLTRTIRKHLWLQPAKGIKRVINNGHCQRHENTLNLNGSRTYFRNFLF